MVGGLGYVFIAAMTATASDAAVRWLGARRWALLHGIGARYIWLVFFLTLLPQGEPRVIEGAFLALMVAMAAVRAAAAWKQRAADARA